MCLGAFLLCLAPAVWAQQPSGGDQNDGRRGRDDRSRWDDPERRERFYNSVVDRYTRNLTEAYTLNPQQREQVRQKLEQLRAEHETYAAPFREEMRRQRESDPNANPWRSEGSRDQMRKMMEGSPLMNSENVVKQIEPMLPAEQVQTGHTKWQEMQQNWRDDRGGNWRDRGRDSWRDGRGSGGDSSRSDRWQRYVEFFNRRYQLDAAQKASADSVLRELTQRRDTYRKAHQADFTAAQAIENRDARRLKYDQLNEPIDKMYDELRSKLDQIPTTAQREIYRASTRPADGATSRPSIQSGDQNRGGRDRGGDRSRSRSRVSDSRRYN